MRDVVSESWTLEFRRDAEGLTAHWRDPEGQECTAGRFDVTQATDGPGPPGARLARALPTGVRDAITTLHNRRKSARVILRGHPDAFPYPWEALQWGGEHFFCPPGEWLTLVRLVFDRPAKPGRGLHSGFRFLLVIGEVPDRQQAKETVLYAEQALAPLCADGLVQITVAATAELLPDLSGQPGVESELLREEEDLKRVLEAGFHFVLLFGRSDASATRGASGYHFPWSQQPIDIARMASYLANQPTRVFVAAACSTPVAQALRFLDHVDHVVTFSELAEDRQTKEWTKALFAALARLEPLHLAVHGGRRAFGESGHVVMHAAATTEERPLPDRSDLEFANVIRDIVSGPEFALQDVLGRELKYIPLRVAQRSDRQSRSSRADESDRADASERLDSTIHDWHHSQEQPAGELEEVPLRQLLAPRRRSLLLGGAGAGKSTLVRQLARQEAQQGGRAALLVNLASLAATTRSRGDSLRSLMQYWAERRLSALAAASRPPAVQSLVAVSQRWLRDGRAFLILDGLDEVAHSDRDALLVDLREIVTAAPCAVLLTSRYGFEQDFPELARETLELLPLRPQDARDYLAHHIGAEKGLKLWDSLQRDSTMRNLVGNPFFLELVTFVFECEQYTLPAGLPLVFDVAVNKLLTMPLAKPGSAAKELVPTLAELEVSLEEMRRVAAEAAWHLFVDGAVREVDEEQLMKALLNALEAHVPVRRRPGSKDVLPFLLGHRLLNQRGENYQFLHLSVQEFLAACHLADPASGLAWTEWLHRKCWRPEWDLVLQFLAGRLRTDDEVTQYVNTLLEPSDLPGGHRDDVHGRRACVASLGLAVAPRTEGWNSQVARVSQALRQAWEAESGGARSLIALLGTTPWLARYLPGRFTTESSRGLSQALVGAVLGKDWYGRYAAADALRGTVDANVIRTLLLNLRDRDKGAFAARALWRTQDPIAIEGLVGALDDEDSHTRWNVGWALRGTEDSVTLLKLLAVVQQGNTRAAHTAATTLTGTRDKGVVRYLILALRDADAAMRVVAARALQGTEDQDAIQGLLGASRDEDREVRDWAVRSLALAPGDLRREKDALPPSVLQAILPCLRDEYSRVREGTAIALEGTQDSTVVRSLLVALKEEDSDVRKAAAAALADPTDPAVVSGLILALNDKSADVRMEAARALRGAEDQKVIEALAIALQDRSSSVRWAACLALRGTQDATAIQGLARNLTDGNWEVRGQAARALSKAQDPAVVRLLVRLLRKAVRRSVDRRDRDDFVAWQAAEALAGTQDEVALQALVITLLRNTSEYARMAAARALADTNHSYVIDALVQALTDRDAQVRYAAALALRRTLRTEPSLRAAIDGRVARVHELRTGAALPIWPQGFVIWPDGTTSPRDQLDPPRKPPVP